MQRFLFFIVFMLLAALTTPVLAAERFARQNGGGSACTEAVPCSLGTCVNATNAGDICTLLDDGSAYFDRIGPGMGLKSGSSWNPGGFVTIRGKPGLRPRFNNYAIDINTNTGTYQFIHFENFVVDGSGIFIGGQAAHDIRVYNVEVKNNAQSGVSSYPNPLNGLGCERVEYAFLDVHDNGSDGRDHGVYNCCKNNIIRDSKFYGNAGYGLQIYWTGIIDSINLGNTPPSVDYRCNSGTIIKNNYIYNNDTWGITIDYGDNVQFFNNVVVGSQAGGGMQTIHHVDNLQIYNNTFYGNVGSAIVFGEIGQATNTKIRNNIFMGNGEPVNSTGSTGTSYSNNLCWQNSGFGNSGTGCTHSGDPKFTAPGNSASSDFSLQDTSAAINIGTNLSPVVTTDKIGTARPQPSGGMYDVGAYERVGTGGGPGPGPEPCPPNCPPVDPPPVEPPPTNVVKAFPSAEGFGSTAVGGRGSPSQPGRTIEVTRLDDDNNPGTLRYCVLQTGPRTCVFRIGGTIALTSPLNTTSVNSYLTIAGQTAPGGGIQTKNWFIQFGYGTHDVIVRHLKVRPGTDHMPTDINNQCGGIVLYRGEGTVHHIILDHVSVEWSCDDSINLSGLIQDTTIQWSIIGEGMNNGDYCHPTSGQCANSKGLLIGDFVDQTVSVHHNMFLTSESRNPAVAGANPLDFRNNLIYNWYACYAGSSFGYQPGGFTRVNYIGNKTIVGPSSGSLTDCRLGDIDYEAIDMYAIDNSTPWCERDGNCSTASFAQMGFIGPSRLGNPEVNELQARVSTPFTVPPVVTTPVANLEALLVAKAGATVPARDALDTRLINEMSGRFGTKGRGGEPWPVLAAGTPPTDADHDGMPDSWEQQHSLNMNEPGDAAQIAANGYSNLENYLNTLAGDTVNLDPPTGNRVSPGVFYVALNGVDPPARDCTAALNNIDAPLLSVNAGRSCITVAGDTLYLRQGSHTTAVSTSTQPITNGSGWNNATTIASYGTETATLVLSSAADVALYFNGSNSYIVLDRLIIDCHNQTNSNGLAMTAPTHHIRFQNGEIKNCHFEPIYIENSDNNEVLNSTIHGSTVASCINLTGGSDNTIIRGNTIHTCAEGGIEAGSPNTNTVIRANVIHDVGTNNTLAGIALTGAATPEVINNVSYTNYRGGQLSGGTSNAKVYNNTFHGNSQQGFFIDSGVNGTTVTNNIVANNTAGQIVNSGSGTTQLTNLTTAPPFDPAFPNKFHLTSASTTAIDVGTALATDVPNDYEGVPRPQGSGFDIGASEFVGTIIPPPPGAIQGPYWRGQGFLWR
jgi:pectate lyase